MKCFDNILQQWIGKNFKSIKCFFVGNLIMNTSIILDGNTWMNAWLGQVYDERHWWTNKLLIPGLQLIYNSYIAEVFYICIYIYIYASMIFIDTHYYLIIAERSFDAYIVKLSKPPKKQFICCGCKTPQRISDISVIYRNTMTSSNGNIFRVTGPLCWEFTGPGELPTQRPVTRMLSLICVWINGWVNNHEAGDLRRHRGHYDVNVMKYCGHSWHIFVEFYCG